MPETRDPEDAGVDLHGWKEIAAYLGRSVRAAQRWERELGLPVRRLKTAAGQAIFARPEEIEAWKARLGEGPRGQQTGRPSGPPALITAVAAAALLLAGAGSVIVGGRVWRDAALPASIAYEGSALLARDGRGATVWSRELGGRFDSEEALSMRPSMPRGFVEADTDGDGVDEILVIIPGRAAAGQEPSGDTLVCLSRDGRERWRYQADLSSFQFGPEARRFDGPWFIRDVVVASQGRARGIWIAAAHHTWWPSAVYRLDDHGRASLAYVQAGAVYALSVGGPPGEETVMAAGVINEVGTATIARLHPSQAAASPHPAGSPFDCRNCPASRPLGLVALPRSELNAAMPMPYNAVRTLRRVTGGVQAHVYEAHEAPGIYASSIFDFDEQLRPRSWSLDDSYWTLHDRWHRQGRIAHEAATCPERARTLSVRDWNGADAWVARPIAHVPLPAPGRRPS